MSIGRRFTGPKARVLGRDPQDYAADLQDWIDRVSDSEADGQPPDHGAQHAFNGSDPLTAPTTTPLATSTASSIGTDPNPARADHVHLNGIVTTKGDLLGFSTVPARLPAGTDGQAVIADSTQLLGVKYGNPAGAALAEILAWLL